MFANDELVVEFSNFNTSVQRTIFYDVRAFSWTEWDNASTDAKPDRIYQVTGSQLLLPWSEFSIGELPFIHLKLGFNAQSKFLDVITTRMESKLLS